MPHFKRKRAVKNGECLNSRISLESHSPVDQPIIETSTEKEANRLAHKENVSNNPWSRLIGRANEEQIIFDGHSVTAC